MNKFVVEEEYAMDPEMICACCGHLGVKYSIEARAYFEFVCSEECANMWILQHE